MSEFRAEPIPPDFEPPPPPPDPPGLVRRWYLTPVVGSGTHDDAYEAKTVDLGPGGGVTALMPTGEDGKPRHPETLALVQSTPHAAMGADPSILPLALEPSFDETVWTPPSSPR
jgi:hypothetical protein